MTKAELKIQNQNLHTDEAWWEDSSQVQDKRENPDFTSLEYDAPGLRTVHSISVALSIICRAETEELGNWDETA